MRHERTQANYNTHEPQWLRLRTYCGNAGAVDAGMDVREAAEKLGLNNARMRKLCAVGALRARRKGGRWLICATVVGERAESAAGLGPGRQPAPRTVWNLLGALDGKHEALNSRSFERALHLVSSIGDPSVAVGDWRHVVAPRGDRVRVRVHPGVHCLASDGRVRRGGVAAAGVSLAGVGVEHVYVSASDLEAVLEEYRAASDPEGTVIMHVSDDSRVDLMNLEIGRSAAGADPLDDPDPRAVAAGTHVLDELCSQPPAR